MSSSLAGALVPPDEQINASSADVDMHSSSFDDATPDTAADLDPKQEEEMGDLFGEDSNVDFVHHSRLVLHYVTALALPSFLNESKQRTASDLGRTERGRVKILFARICTSSGRWSFFPRPETKTSFRI
jgi:hypothetical protein